MTARRPLVRVGGRLQQLPANDTIEGAPPTDLSVTRDSQSMTIRSSTRTGSSGDAYLPVANGAANLAGLMSAADQTKLAGVQAGATANSTDTYLLNRANHQGTQTLSTLSDAGAAAAQPIYIGQTRTDKPYEVPGALIDLYSARTLFMARSTADGEADWNYASAPGVADRLMAATDANGPGFGTLAFCRTTTYSSQGTTSLCQEALGYPGSTGYPRFARRHRQGSGSYGPWVEEWNNFNFNPAEYAKLDGPTLVGALPLTIRGSASSFIMVKKADGTNLGFVGKGSPSSDLMHLGAYASDIFLSTVSGYYTRIGNPPPAGDRSDKVPSTGWFGSELATALLGTGISLSGSSQTVLASWFANGALYMRFTGTSALTLTVPANSAQAIPVGAELTVRRAANANLTIVPASGVVVNPPAGGTLVMTQNMTATLKKVALNEWDLIGQTVAA